MLVDFGKEFMFVKSIVIDGIKFINSGYGGSGKTIDKKILDYMK